MKYNLNNWVNGMKTSKTHFEQLENHFIERLCDTQAIQLTNNSYGLLPVTGDNDSSEIEISQGVTGNVEVRLRRCNAVTSGGCRIDFPPMENEDTTLRYTIDTEEEAQDNQLWDIILTVDPYNREPNGTPDEDELPPRHPYATTTYKLSVLPHGNINARQLGLHHLIIGRIRKRDGSYEVDRNYIPPCMCMNSHYDLTDYYENFGIALKDMELASKSIIQKIQNRTQNSVLANNINALCQDMMRYIAAIYYTYRNNGRYYAPVDVVGYISNLAHLFYVNLTFIPKTEKEELLKYFYEWNDITPASFEGMLADMLEVMYDHQNIRTTMIQTEHFLHNLSSLWQKLSQLEYIGQHKESIVISEYTQQTTSTKKDKKEWSIFG